MIGHVNIVHSSHNVIGSLIFSTWKPQKLLESNQTSSGCGWYTRLGSSDRVGFMILVVQVLNTLCTPMYLINPQLYQYVCMSQFT